MLRLVAVVLLTLVFGCASTSGLSRDETIAHMTKCKSESGKRAARFFPYDPEGDPALCLKDILTIHCMVDAGYTSEENREFVIRNTRNSCGDSYTDTVKAAEPVL